MPFTRRRAIQWMASAVPAALHLRSIAKPPQPASSSQPVEITGVHFHLDQLHHDALSNGDTWDYIWADDGLLYTFNDDGRGYGTGAGRNLAFNKLTGDTWNNLTGSGVNPMDYGKGGAKAPNGSNWKTTGADCIDGVFYCFLANNWYGSQNAYGGSAPDPHIRQTVTNMSLIKSTDKGLTWTRDAQTNYDHPMWTSTRFSTAYFVKYGQNGGQTTQDDQDRFVYAISNDGFWNCGANLYLGRVLRAKLPDLNPADWQYLANGAWSSSLDDATPIPGFPNGLMKCTSGSPIWLPALRKYVTVTWYDPGTSLKWHYPENVTFAFYQADHPWGPWSWVGEQSACDFIADRTQRIHRWYGPSLSPRWITPNPDGSVTAILTFSGQTWEDKPDGLYKNNAMPVTFYTAPQPLAAENIDDSDLRVHYTGAWTQRADLTRGDYGNDAHLTSAPGAAAELAFTGTGIEVLCEKSHDLGDLEVILDSAPPVPVRLFQDPMPLLYQVPVFRRMDLPPGQHTIRVVHRSAESAPIVLDGFRVYPGAAFASSTPYRILNRANRRPLAPLAWTIAAAGGDFTLTRHPGGAALGVNLQEPLLGPIERPLVSSDPAQRWTIRLVGNGSYSLTNRATGLALTAGENGLGHAAYYGRDEQKWEFTPTQTS